ncbi:hypothetical protein E5D57_009754 [Metarhizium anisopliae]|nr:hypothetical protein E5D57_009754 [Metarhizium anisopliae]
MTPRFPPPPPAAQAAAYVEVGNKHEPRHISRLGKVLDPRVDSSKLGDTAQAQFGSDGGKPSCPAAGAI